MTIDQNPTPTDIEATESGAPAEAPVEAVSEAVATEATVETTAPEATAPDVTESVTEVTETPAPAAEEPAAPTQTEAPVTEAPVAVEETVVAEAPVVEAPVAEAPVEPAPVIVAAPVKEKVSDIDLFESYMAGDFSVEGDSPDGGFKRLSKGERIEATVIQVDADKVFVDLGTKAEGIVPLSELSEDNLQTAIGLFNIGDRSALSSSVRKARKATRLFPRSEPTLKKFGIVSKAPTEARRP